MSLDHDKLTGHFSTQQLWYMKQAETLPGLKPDIDSFKLKRVSGFILGNLLQDISADSPVVPHSYASHSAIERGDSPYEHYLNEGTLGSFSVNPFWNLQVELYTPRATEHQSEPITDPAAVRIVGIEWWPNDNAEGEMDEYYPDNGISFSRRHRHDHWTPSSQGIPIAEQLDVLLLIGNLKQMKPLYAAKE